MLTPAAPLVLLLLLLFAVSGDRLGNGGKSAFFVGGGSIAVSDRTNNFGRRAKETLFAPTSDTCIAFASSSARAVVLLLCR
jgi:hypothetical protein